MVHELIKHTIAFNRLPELATFRTATEGVGKYMQLLRSRAKAEKQLLWHIVPIH